MSGPTRKIGGTKVIEGRKTQTRSQSLLICSSKAMKDWEEMMSRSRGRLGRAIFVRSSLGAMRCSQNHLRSDWERVWERLQRKCHTPRECLE